MTGFGRGQREEGGVRATCEVKTLNHKGLDIKVRLAREASALEPAVVLLVKGKLERGRVDLAIDIEGGHDQSIDAAAVTATVLEVRALCAALGVPGELTPGDVVRVALGAHRREGAPNVDALAPAILGAVDDALVALREARAAEGAHLAAALEARLAAIDDLRLRLAVRAADAPARLADKLKARLEAIAIPLDPARVAQEAALLADRADVHEELERLEAHVTHARDVLGAAATSSAGRKLDFLCQELLREANTLGSKCQDAPTAHLVVELKTEIERLREQVQNAE
jgi:uncharacterized protein (TIGR00255 family)